MPEDDIIQQMKQAVDQLVAAGWKRDDPKILREAIYLMAAKDLAKELQG